MGIPEDPFLAVSFVNTELRDRFDSLEALCTYYETTPEALRKKLKAAGFAWNGDSGKFV
jgi:hypothetical protein